MKKRNKQNFRRLSLLLSLIALCPILLGAAPSHTNEFYVNDYADVLSEETEQHIFDTARNLDNETTAQVCVLTIESLDGEDISEYSVETFRKWGIGDKDTDNGVLIVLSVDDREMWITSGYGIEGTLTDAKLGALRDTYAIPYYSENDFDTGTKLLFGAIVNEIRTGEYGLEPLDDMEYYGDSLIYDDSELLDDGDFIIFALFMLAAFVLPFASYGFTIIKYIYLLRYDKAHGTTRASQYKMRLKKIRRTYTNGTGHHHGGGFHGGGFGGGGGFRGGGGSTGGGGAGGRF